MDIERRNGDFIRNLIETSQVDTCHDLSDGGLIAGLSDMAISGNIGASITVEDNLPLHVSLFSETQARYLIAVPASTVDAIMQDADQSDVPIAAIGTTGGTTVSVNGDAVSLVLSELASAHADWMPNFMANAT
ncbi:MAG: hypothetical protein JKY60_01420 [Kordiimonadaceae bacterium]|nr:hypothetical protein [Kordiimonadaceae bacterium]